MPVGTEVGGRGEDITDDATENAVRKFLKSTNAAEGTLSDMYARDQLLMLYALPEPVKKRLRALKKLQVSIINMEANFYNDIHSIEMQYYQQYKAIFEKRAKIVLGKYEPREDELHPEQNLPEISPEVHAKLKLEQAKLPEGPGIPNFWLTIFRNVGVLSEITFPQDEDILKHLADIKVTLNTNPMGFLLEFLFTQNEYFTNTVLTKEYEMKCKPDDVDPFSFEGPEIYKTKGCIINWKPNKDITVKTVRKKQKHKSKGTIRTVLKTVKNESFFNFFSPPKIPEGPPTALDEEIQVALTSDFEIGHFLKERVIPHAILYYTGEALDDEESYEDDDEEEDEEEDEESGSRSAASTSEEEDEDQRSESATESAESDR